MAEVAPWRVRSARCAETRRVWKSGERRKREHLVKYPGRGHEARVGGLARSARRTETLHAFGRAAGDASENVLREYPGREARAGGLAPTPSNQRIIVVLKLYVIISYFITNVYNIYIYIYIYIHIYTYIHTYTYIEREILIDR